MADAALSPDDTLSPAQIAAANPKGIPQAVDTPGGEPFDLSGAATGSSRYQGAINDLNRVTSQHLGELSATQRENDRRDAQLRARQEQMLDQEGATVQDLKNQGVWNAQTELAKHKTDLWSQFGSPGFVIGMLASAFTAMPMNSALNAGAAAMNAINQGDMEGYNKAFEAWKTNTDLTLKRLDEQHKEYADIDHLRSSNMADWRAKMATILAKYGDERKLALLNNGYDEDLLHAQDAEVTSARNMATARDSILQNKVVMDALNGHLAQPGEAVTHKDAKGNPMAGGDPRYYKGTDILGAYTDAVKKIKQAEFPYRGMFGGAPTKEKEITRIKDDLMAKAQAEGKKLSEADAYKKAAQEVEASHKTLTPNEKIKQEAHLEQYDLVLTDILPEIDGILKRHVGAAGAAGYATRAAESVSNVFGSNDTDRRQFESDIDHLKLVAPNLLLDRTTGRPLSAEHEYIDKIIRGLNVGDTTANTLRSLAEVKRRLERLRAGVASRIGGDDNPQQPVAPPKADPAWDQFPEVK